MQTNTMTPALEYARPLKWHQRHRLRRVVMSFVLLALITLAAWQLGPSIYYQCRMLYWQRQCMNHVDPPGTLFSAIRYPDKSSPMPREFEAFHEFVSDPRLPRAVTATPRFGWWKFSNDWYMYMHARQAPAGKRLVCVFDCTPSNIYAFSGRGHYPQIVLAVCILKPGNIFSPPAVISRKDFVLSDGAFRTIGDYRMESGPVDENKFILTVTTYDYSPRCNIVVHNVEFHINAADEPEAAANSLGL